jgi:hypothetical protein
MAGKVSVPISVAVQGIAKTQAQLGQLGKGLSNIAKTAGLAAIGFAAFTIGVKSADFAAQAIAGARDLERNLAGLKSVFEETTPQMEAFSRNAVSMGLSLTEASKASTFIGSVIKQSGFSIAETADLTERLVGLGTDLAITYGYDVQEALMGMTALFRGEYDPIEKFGVAMKQSEVNSELAAKGMGNLEGAQRRFAEQQVRVELLFQRASDAAGQFGRQSGTLAVEQLKLQAAFSNVKDTVATSLLPVITNMVMTLKDLMESVGPELKIVFDELAPVLGTVSEALLPAFAEGLYTLMDIFKEIINLIGDMFDATTPVGEAFTFLGEQFDAVFSAIFSTSFTTENVFELIGDFVEVLALNLGNILMVIEEVIITARALLIMIQAVFNRDPAILEKGLGRIKDEIRESITLAKTLDLLEKARDDRARVAANATEAMSDRADQAMLRRAQNSAKVIVESAEEIIKDGLTGGKAKKVATDHIKELFDAIQSEIAKQTVSIKLRAMGASEGLVSQIIGSEGMMKIMIALKKGTISLEDLQKQFNRTATGAKELADAAKEVDDAIQAYADAIAEIENKLADDLASIAEKAAQAKKSFQDLTSSFDILPTIARQIGQFESAVTGYLESIESSLKSAFDNGDLLDSGYQELVAYARKELQILAGMQQQRDELANRFDLSEALIANYRTALTSALSLTAMIDSASQKTQEVTVTEMKRGIVRLGGDLREFSVTLARTYTETIEDTSTASEKLVGNFRDMTARVKAFAANLRSLKALGLDPQLFDQLVQAGVTAGGETAQALIDGGAVTINEINGLFQEIDALGAGLGEEVAATLYGAGIDLADGLLAGIRSKQSEIENLARSMAEAFNANFSAAVKIQIDQAAGVASGAATAAADAAKAAVPVPAALLPVVNVADQEKLRLLIEGATRFIGNVADTAQKAGGQVKLDIFNSLAADIAAGKSVNLSGIKSGLSSADLASAAANATGTTQNITINVKTDATQSTAMVGQTLGTIITSYAQTGGRVLT